MRLAVEKVLKVISNVTGISFCENNKEKLLDIYNRINETFYAEKVWSHLLIELDLCIKNKCFTLPEEVEKITALRLCNRDIPIEDKYYKYRVRQNVRSNFLDDCCSCHGCGVNDYHCRCVNNLEFLGDRFATYQDLPYPMHIVAFSDRMEQADSKMRIYSKDKFGVEERHYDQIKAGIDLPIQHEDTANVTEQIFQNTPYRIEKPVTNGYVEIYGLDKNNLNKIWLGRMKPTEKSACYTRYQVNTPKVHSSIRVLVQKRPVEQLDETEEAFLPFLEAYRRMAVAVKDYDLGEFTKFQISRNFALSFIKKTEETKENKLATNFKTGNYILNRYK